MTFKQVALSMWPAWVAGAIIILATAKSKFRDLLAVKLPAIKFFICFAAVNSILRLIAWKLFHRMTVFPINMKEVAEIPWQAGLFVFWEDATHILPLLIFQRIISGRKYMYLFYFAIMFLIMLDFGLGHIYQSLLVGLVMMFYIPAVMNLGKQFGVGTVMICHTIFDLSAMATVAISMKGH